MEEKRSFETWRSKLIAKLSLIENLVQRLVNAPRSTESLILLERATYDLSQLTHNCDDVNIADTAAQMRRLVSMNMTAGFLPEAERARLTGLIGRLRRILSDSVVRGALTEMTSVIACAQDELIVVSAAYPEALLAKLKGSGFQTRHLGDLRETETLLLRALPLAILIDVEFPEGSLAGIEMIGRLRNRVDMKAPVFFLSERDSFDQRLAAVRAGGAGYFIKPVETSTLLKKLNNRLSYKTLQDRRGVLIIDDSPGKGSAISAALEAKGIAVRVVDQPRLVLQVIESFTPELIVLDMDLRGLDGIDLAGMLRQHPACEDRAIILITGRRDPDRQLATLDVERTELLIKPVATEYLAGLVTFHLRRVQVLHTRMYALANKDPITDLYNRPYFLAALERTIAPSASKSPSCAVMLILIDNLSLVRESTDVATADEVIAQAAKRLQKALPGGSLAARFGDVMFAVMIKAPKPDVLHDLAQTVRRVLGDNAYRAQGHVFHLHTCVGIGIAGKDGPDYLTLIQRADLACTLAREQGGDCIHIHYSAIDRQAEEMHEQRLLQEILDSIEQGSMGIVFQPVASLKSDLHERYEVLLRMHNRAGHELLPETVFKLADKHRLGVALDRWVIAHSIRLLEERLQRVPRTTLFINISPVTLQNSSALQTWLEDRLEKSTIDPGRIVLEVTEAIAHQYPVEFREFVKVIRSLGCRLSLQHFGRRSDSFKLLRDLFVEYVKLDLYFVQGLAENKLTQQKLHKMVKSIEALNTTVIVCGVEDLRALPVLWSCGINFVQGFFLQPPHDEMSYDFSESII